MLSFNSSCSASTSPAFAPPGPSYTVHSVSFSILPSRRSWAASSAPSAAARSADDRRASAAPSSALEGDRQRAGDARVDRLLGAAHARRRTAARRRRDPNSRRRAGGRRDPCRRRDCSRARRSTARTGTHCTLRSRSCPGTTHHRTYAALAVGVALAAAREHRLPSSTPHAPSSRAPSLTRASLQKAALGPSGAAYRDSVHGSPPTSTSHSLSWNCSLPPSTGSDSHGESSVRGLPSSVWNSPACSSHARRQVTLGRPPPPPSSTRLRPRRALPSAAPRAPPRARAGAGDRRVGRLHGAQHLPAARRGAPPARPPSRAPRHALPSDGHSSPGVWPWRSGRAATARGSRRRRRRARAGSASAVQRRTASSPPPACD